jgi:hypothetical protein
MPLGFQINADELDAPDHPANRIYLDGSCQGPYIDPARNLYSFDHHGKGTIRSITDAACVQVMKFARDRIVGAVGYEVIGNHKDLDMLLAAYGVLHADRIAFDNAFFDLFVPHVLLEGNIDALGPNRDRWTGLSAGTINLVNRNLDVFQAAMDEAKAKGDDLLDPILAGLEMMDRELLEGHIKRPVNYVGYKEIPIPGKWNIVLVISQKHKINAVLSDIEQREVKKKRKCCLVIWHDGDRVFTLRRTGIASGFSLEPVYEKLNQAETRAKLAGGIKDKDILNAGWGGDDLIGGSPRYKKMSPYIGIEEIERIVTEEVSRQAENMLGDPTQRKSGNGNGNGHSPKPPDDPKAL